MKKTNESIFRKGLLISVSLILLVPLFASWQEKTEIEEEPKIPILPDKFYRIALPANMAWKDCGVDVLEGQVIHFRASGGISLQQGNPIASCGPDGYRMTYVHQPIEDQKLGSLIGRVVKLISIEVDEETGEEIRNEEIELFHIGSEGIITMPQDGRLYLGINELVVADNSGQFQILYYWRQEFRL